MKDNGVKKIGFLGGAFDPIHLGHLIIAQDAYEQAELDSLYLVPTAQSPLKANAPQTTNEQRLAMVQAAIEEIPSFGVIDDELKRGGESFTYDTVASLRERWPDDRLFWIIGADQVEQLPLWHRIADLLKIVEFICIGRPGHKLQYPIGIPHDRLFSINGHLFDVSSTEIRTRIASGQSARFYLPAPVNDYIEKESLYQ
ncbi:nicotinate-nucleotide adenylyltransferase [Rubellicoccus peritrichatus]|uniref:Probable nicotinate-nucleotide adenylyltransferase n=1 Tax=Rubellicoccus peritrichatus TaxID=3080537 RepID=A0AAQ3LFV0_9BACT|nr:nicotinate-nucleotide adenylyltransferase [Puniceicoccus sp. CR14]WOO41314.1 nicotinate-nucleotide adenylyltransferase [Puniceicoccus sp. CR14]